MAGPIAGHGATIAITLDPVGAPGVFTTIAQAQDISGIGMSRGETEVTAHDQTIDRWVLSKRIVRDPLTGTVNFVFDDTTHIYLQEALEVGDVIGVQIRGPQGSSGSHEWLGSGEVQKFGPVMYPVREGVATAEFALRLSGPMWRDGELIGV